MKPFTFSLLEQLQRADAALRLERGKDRPSRLALVWLARRRKLLAARFRRSLCPLVMAEA